MINIPYLYNMAGTGKTPKSRRSCSGTTRCHRWKRPCFGSSTWPGTAVRNIWGRPPTTFIGSSTCFWTSCCWCRLWSCWWHGWPKKCFGACSAGAVDAAKMSPHRQQRRKKHNDFTSLIMYSQLSFRSKFKMKKNRVRY